MFAASVRHYFLRYERRPCLCVSRSSARQWEYMCDVGELDVDRQNGDVEVQQHGSLQAWVGSVVHQEFYLQGAVFHHIEVPFQHEV